MFGGLIFMALIFYSFRFWAPTMMIRAFDISLSEVGLILGIITIISSITGTILAGTAVDYLRNKNYTDAEKFLQRAVELKPSDPIINDHYGDTLWMVNKNIQARYFWKYVLSLDDADEELIKNINKKLIFGINKNL